MGYIGIFALLIYGLIMLTLYNEFLDLFEFKSTPGEIVKVEELDLNSLRIYYYYSVNSMPYEKNFDVAEELYNGKNNNEIVEIIYNTTYPEISYISGLKLMSRYTVTVWVAVIFFILLLFFSFIVDHDKWIAIYKKTFQNM